MGLAAHRETSPITIDGGRAGSGDRSDGSGHGVTGHGDGARIADLVTRVLGTGRTRMTRLTAASTLVSLGLLADLLLVVHTTGSEIWGPLVAAFAALVGALSFTYLAVGARSRAPRIALYLLWATVALFGYGGFQSHRLPRPADTITDQRPRPPLAPLVFTGIGIGGAITLRKGTKGY